MQKKLHNDAIFVTRVYLTAVIVKLPIYRYLQYRLQVTTLSTKV